MKNMFLLLKIIVICYSLTLSTAVFMQPRADSCDTYVHPQYGLGQCVDTSLCPNALYISGLCESKPVNIKCCFSLNQPGRDEFRAIWIATASNIDWPTSRTATPATQRNELIDILNMVQRLNMNAVIFQVRPAGDAFYSSILEPWSMYLTGTHGIAPSPLWDPLEFVLIEAHKRNIEVHAWINPYRARMKGATYTPAPTNMAKRFPQYAYTYDSQLWMDPGSKEVQAFVLSVAEDILRRYAVDGLHIDDYFYPYGDGTEFPDASTYAAYQQQGGTMNKADWRRSNVNYLVEALYNRTHAVRPKAKFGVSPFGIWKSGTPAGIVGLSAYDSLYCDSRLWLQKGIVDYLSPQLYWAIDPPAQSYTTLLNWWTSQSTMGRHIYPGNAAYRMTQATNPWAVTEIIRQVNFTRTLSNRYALGNIFFSTKQLLQNVKGIQTELAKLYMSKALTPTMTWL